MPIFQGRHVMARLEFADVTKPVILHIVVMAVQRNEAVKIKKFAVNTSITTFLISFMKNCSHTTQSRS